MIKIRIRRSKTTQDVPNANEMVKMRDLERLDWKRYARRPTKAAVKKVKTATEKVQSTKVKKAEAATARDNAKRTLTKTTRKKGELNEMPDTGTATQGDEGRIRPE